MINVMLAAQHIGGMCAAMIKLEPPEDDLNR